MPFSDRMGAGPWFAQDTAEADVQSGNCIERDWNAGNLKVNQIQRT
jgi:hypothetical protein